jgi:paraquat-inducible protein B
MAGIDEPALPRPRVERRRRWPFSAVWIVPLVAAVAAIAIAAARIAREGPTVTVTFKSASGLEPGKTLVKFKDVTVGRVTAVRLSANYDSADVIIRMDRQATSLVTQGASFWIVRPRLSLSEISGLGTLFSGNYIGFDRGSGNEGVRRFVGLESPQVVSPGTPGRHFTLRAANVENVDVGRPVYYRGVRVGEVASYGFSADGRAVDVGIFVNSPHDAYVHPATRFWNVSGLDVSVGTDGLNVRTSSLVSLLMGGLAFDNGPLSEGQGAARDGASFTLHRDRATAMKQPDPDERRYVLHFDESLQGVEAGSPVTILGIACGEVTSVGLALDRKSGRMRGRVEITFSPERFFAQLPADQVAQLRDIDRDVAKRNALLRRAIVTDGLRAQLRSASLVSGQRYVAFEYFAHAPPTTLDLSGHPVELPVVRGTFPALEDKVTALLDKLNALPLQAVAVDTRDALREARQALAGVKDLARGIDEKALPEFVSAAEDARGALASAQRMLDGASATLVGPDAPGQRELRTALEEVARAARSLRVMSDSIERQPQSLLWGRKNEATSQ